MSTSPGGPVRGKGGLEVTRWGARDQRNIAPGGTVVVPAFVDFKLFSPPQELAIALYAFADQPVGGLSVEWHVQVGNGSTNNVEVTLVPVQDVFMQTPTTMLRPAAAVQISARIFSSAAAPKLVTLIAAIGPTGPTWGTSFAPEDC